MAQVLIGIAINTGLALLQRALMPDTNVEGSRLKEAQVTSSTEGVAIARLFGRMRMGGNLFWATKYLETVTTTSTKSGKGGGPSTNTTSYTYSVSFAIGLCEGAANTQMGRVWADGKLLDTSKYTIRFYPGSTTQTPDSFMETIEGAGRVPAYRGLCYMMFEQFPLAEFGNRIPNISVEVIKPLETATADDLEELIECVAVGPGTGEFATATTAYVKDNGRGLATSENTHNSDNIPDFTSSIDTLQASAPNVATVMLTAAWFTSDLRAGSATVKPKVQFGLRSFYTSADLADQSVETDIGTFLKVTNNDASSQVVDIRDATGAVVSTFTLAAATSRQYRCVSAGIHRVLGVTVSAGAVDSGALLQLDVYQNESITPYDWKVSGLERDDALEVAADVDGNPLFGGTPADRAIYEAIVDLTARGIVVSFCPIILCDQVEGNGLTDPYGGAEQAALPWRGRITCNPAPGQPSTPDTTATAATQVNAFFGSAAASDIGTGSDGLPTWTGSASEWGYRRMVLHYAKLCALAGGVGSFLLGSQLKGLTQVRSDTANTFPAVAALVTLAADVAAILPSAQLSYSADWTEYGAYVPPGSPLELRWPLDSLWASANIDIVCIEYFAPMSDWRDGTTHLDYSATVTNPYDLDYLKSNIEGGEFYDWTYADDAARDAQTRTPITDTAYSKPWVYRPKDIRNWWSRAHYTRSAAGTQSGSPTSWVASSKPLGFTPFGCPAVNKGTNQPSVAYDINSSESAFPHYSNQSRDDLIQRRCLEAMIQYWRDNSPVGMLSTDSMVVAGWDVRPYPAFPSFSAVWPDAPNWRTGHWITGRLGLVSLALLVEDMCELAGLDRTTDLDTTGLYGSSAVVRGYLLDKIMAPREMIEPLMTAFNFDSSESGGRIKFFLRANATPVALTTDQLVSEDNNLGGYSITKSQVTELPKVVKLSFYDEGRDYDTASVNGSKGVGNSLNVASIDLPLVFDTAYAQALADTMVHEAWTSRDKAELALPPSLLLVDPGDLLNITIKARDFSFRVVGIEGGEYRKVEAASFDVSVFDFLDFAAGGGSSGAITVYGESFVVFMDMPLTVGDEVRPWAPRALAYQSPWPGTVNVFEDDDAGGFDLDTQITVPSSFGVLVEPLYSADPFCFTAGTITVEMFSDTQLLSTTDLAVLNGANTIAIRNEDGLWEFIQFATATLVGTRKYELTRLIRGQLGSEGQMRDPHSVGSLVVYMGGSSFYPVDQTTDQIDIENTFRSGPAPLPMADARYQEQAVTSLGIGLWPYAPVQQEAVRDGSGVTFSWLRRTRYSGDTWPTGEPPLNEESEAYEVDVMDGTTVLRTLTSTTNSVLYAAADETADFGGAQTSIKIRVYQMSATVGRGFPGESTVVVT